jgi:uncharacterized protein (TIGR02466 family)
MSEIESLFATKIYRAELGGAAGRRKIAALEAACRSIAADDTAGQAWCEANGYPGYTSYASLDDLPQRFPEFADLVPWLDTHVAAFAKELDFDLQGRALTCDSLWLNVLPPGGFHAAHIHPHAAISGTLYVAVPKGAAGLKLEDPRLARMMAAPPRRSRAQRENRTFVTLDPKPGTLLLWESWLTHEVPPSRASEERISVSFNYRWG